MSFFEKPILNSPYEEPSLYHVIDDDGLPVDAPPKNGRRKSDIYSPVPRPKKKNQKQAEMELFSTDGISNSDQEYNPTPIINEIRSHVSEWRKLPNPNDWGVTQSTAKLLMHWRQHRFAGIRPFFCQIEAVETLIWLTEVAPKNATMKKFAAHIKGANEMANPELIRLAMKMATGTGKTTVMAMIIAWQTVNAVRSPSSKNYSRGFLLVAPGVTIRDRLRVLLPSDPESYFKTRELLPADMLQDIQKAKIVITNYHSFMLRETIGANKVSKSLLKGRGEDLKTTETEGQMVRRVADELMGIKNIVVINDEAHHCYRERPGAEDLEGLKGEERDEANEHNKAARTWINGLEAFKRKLGIRAVYDLSATPFFLSGSGWPEGTLFPWTVSDFSLMDAIESGIVKLPRVPVSDNIPNTEMPVFRDLWKHIGKDLPKKGKTVGDPDALPDKLKTALYALYKHYTETDQKWRQAGIETPPVFIVVCNNTSTSRLVYEWISGWTRPNEDNEEVFERHGNLKLFSNFNEHGDPLPKPNTLLIDSNQLESGEALDKNFRDAMAPEIERFKRERAERSGAGSNSGISDEELLREVMNTVGKKGQLGEQIRCVVSVSMLTEGWDTNSVTHILGVRAFGTQLLCEQVVGRGLRRYNYELNEDGLFDVEYADIMGIPFDFTAKPAPAAPKAPKKSTQVKTMKERKGVEIRFPRVSGYRTDLPEDILDADFSEDSKLELTPEMVGPGSTEMLGIVGEGITITLAQAKEMRPSEIAFRLTQLIIYKYFKDEDGQPKLYLFNQVKRVVRRWINEGYLVTKGNTGVWMIEYPSIGNQAAERIYQAIVKSKGSETIRAVLDPYNPEGSTAHVNFTTVKSTYQTNPTKCHVNYVVTDSGWEAEFARAVENHPRTIAYVKNQGLGFEIPYRDGNVQRQYVPDFIVQVDDGRGSDNPLNLIVEVKGQRDENVKIKSETTRNSWVPGVNNLGQHGRWAFVEFTDVFEMEENFRKLIDEAIGASEGVA